MLLVKRANDPWKSHWDVPGGFCDEGEHPQDTAIRESLEEAGARVELVGLLGMWMDRYGATDPARPTEHVLAIYYLARLMEEELLTGDPEEIDQVQWFAADRLPLEIAFPNHLPMVLDLWRSTLSIEAG